MLFLILYYLIDIRKPFLGVITILPVVAIVMGTYLGMYFLDIPLNPVTSTLSGLAIGIGVPFVIHVTNRFRESLTTSDNPVEAVRTALKTTGGSLFGSAFTTMAGFGILMTSSLKPFQQMGQVVVVALGFALVASILILPTLLVFGLITTIEKQPNLYSKFTTINNMNVKELYQVVNKLCPFEDAFEDDKVGVLVGSEKAEVKNLLVSHDISKEVLDKCVKEDFDTLITHIILQYIEN